MIGAIANQDFGTEKHLEEYGIRSYFNTITASAEEEVAKPDPEIFRRAFKSAGCSAENAVMIGDRLDNDIAPAKALGMKTIWIKQGFSAYCSPTCPQEQPDYTFLNLLELKNIYIEGEPKWIKNAIAAENSPNVKYPRELHIYKL